MSIRTAMLRTIVGLCTFLSVVIPLIVGGSTLSGRRQSHIARELSLCVAESNPADSQPALESENPTDNDPQPPSSWNVDVCAPTSVRRLVTGRRDRDSTHLDALLTCGRLLI